MGIADEIEKLNKLRQDGAISEDEYNKAKESVLSQDRSQQGQLNQILSKSGTDVNVWSMYIHLSQFCGYVAPVAGFVVPIILWQIKKNESEIIDKHGKIVLNWILSEFILILAGVLLCIVIIGIPILIAVGIMGFVFPIIGGIKANSGEIWPYPLSINFCGVD